MSSSSMSCCTACGTAADSCCCTGTRVRTPESVANRPGLSALHYRVGTYPTFFASMQARLTQHAFRSLAADSGKVSERRPLQALRVRTADDASIALLDAASVVTDVLTFYQERIANEGFLRTATERRSIVELASLVGYRLKPGVSASTFLAYSIDDNTKEEVLIPRGSKAQSVPGPDETPQTFETSEDLRARANWNRLSPRQTRPQSPRDLVLSHRLFLDGISTRLRPGDPLLVRGGQMGELLLRVIEAVPEPEAARTRVSVEPWLQPAASTPASPQLRALTELIDLAPTGKLADGVKLTLQRLRAALAVEPLSAVRHLVETETSPTAEDAVARLQSLPAAKLRPWLARVQHELQQLMAADRPAEAALKPGVSREQTGEPGFAGQLSQLVAPGSKPLANALQLRRDLSSNFSKTSDAGLRATTANAPELRRAAVIALATDSNVAPASDLEVYALRVKTGLFGRAFPRQTLTEDVIVSQTSEEDEENNETTITTTRTTVTDEWRVSVGDAESFSEQPNTVHLDGAHEGILPGQWIALDFSGIPGGESAPDFKLPGALLISKVDRVLPKQARSEYGATGDSTRIQLPVGVHWIERGNSQTGGNEGETRNERNFRVVRRVAVYAQSERLALAELPIGGTLCQEQEADGYIELDELYSDLEPGRFVIVQGERADLDGVRGVMATEALMLSEVVHDVRAADLAVPNSTLSSDGEPPAPLAGDRTHTFIRTDKSLNYCYHRDSLSILANVVRATHGETRREVLGSGDGSKPSQSFSLKQSPLTFLAAATPAGAESTLQVYVNDVRWHELDSLQDAAPSAHAYVTRIDDANTTRVSFGDGRHGARLPAGNGNITAVYRNGIGKAGNVRADQISTLGSRPLGVREVKNPLPASGGADRESRDQGRKLVPLATRALDRLVSVQDYADFALTFAGIAKAAAVELSDGRRNIVHVTVAGADDIPIAEDSDLLTSLSRALRELGDPFQPLLVAPRELLLLAASVNLRIHPDYIWEKVVAAVRTRLVQALGFENSELAQRTYASELVSAAQSVPGVVYVDLDTFGPIRTLEYAANGGSRRPRTPEEIALDVANIANQPSASFVAAKRARNEAGTLLPAQLAMFSSAVPDTLVLNRIQ